jgi:hypothetical protein
MNHKSRVFPVLLIAISLFLPLAVFGHGALVLKSTTSERTYTTTANEDGSFSFQNVVPGTYTLSIVGPKEYFTALASEVSSSIAVQNLQWLATGDGAPASSVIFPTVTVTSDILSNPYYTLGAEPKKEYSVILYSALVTPRRANLSGMLTNSSDSRESNHQSVVSR